MKFQIRLWQRGKMSNRIFWIKRSSFKTNLNSRIKRRDLMLNWGRKTMILTLEVIAKRVNLRIVMKVKVQRVAGSK